MDRSELTGAPRDEDLSLLAGPESAIGEGRSLPRGIGRRQSPRFRSSRARRPFVELFAPISVGSRAHSPEPLPTPPMPSAPESKPLLPVPTLVLASMPIATDVAVAPQLPEQSAVAPPPPEESVTAAPPPEESAVAPPPPEELVAAAPPPEESVTAAPPPEESVAAAPPPEQPVAAPPEHPVATALPLEPVLDARPPAVARDAVFRAAVYHSASYDRAAQAILSAIGRRERVVVLTGEAGTGKTTLCEAVMDQVDARTFTTLLADPFDTIEDALRTILADFGVISRDPVGESHAARMTRHELHVALRGFLRSLAPLNARATVFVDEAQRLSVELLPRVCAIAEIEREKRLIQVVLVGQPALLTTLKRPELGLLDKRITGRWELGLLGRDELAEYVAHRAAAAGDRGRAAFDESGLNSLWRASHGVPGLVGRICDRLLSLEGEPPAAIVDGAAVESAARDLDVVPPPSARSTPWWRVLVLLATTILVVSAGAAVWFFRDGVLDFVTRVGLR